MSLLSVPSQRSWEARAVIDGLRLGEGNRGLILLWIYTCEETSQETREAAVHGQQDSAASLETARAGVGSSSRHLAEPIYFRVSLLLWFSFLLPRSWSAEGCVPYREQ